MARRKAREYALQMLFEWDVRRIPPDEIVERFFGSLLEREDSKVKPKRDAFAESLLRGVIAEIVAIDEVIARHAKRWRIERMPVVDRNVLRLGVYELMRTDTEPAVAIDEAIELARRFSGEEAVEFVNGVLDAASKQQP